MIDIDVSKIVSEIGEPKARFIENEDEKQQKIYLLVFSSIFLFIFLAGVFVFLFLSRSENTQLAVVNKDVDTIRTNNNDLESTNAEAQFIQKRNNNLLNIIEANPNWSYVLETLEDVVPKEITFTRFDLESSSTMSLTGISPDYDTLSKLVVAMNNYTVDKQNVFGNVNIDNASLTTSQQTATQVNFAVSFAFLKKINRQSINPVTSQTNTPTPNPTVAPTVPTSSETTPSPAAATPPIATPPTPSSSPSPSETPAQNSSPTPAPAPSEGSAGGLPTL